MSDQAKMTKILGEMITITDEKCLETIQSMAFGRRRDLNRKKAENDTADWMVDDDVQLLPELRSRKPYGVVGKIIKINKVKMKVNFGHLGLYTVPKSMLMKA